MNKNDFSNLGNELKQIVKTSINSGDYHKIGQEVGNTMNNALESAFAEVRKAMSSVQINLNSPNNTVKPPNSSPGQGPQPTYSQPQGTSYQSANQGTYQAPNQGTYNAPNQSTNQRSNQAPPAYNPPPSANRSMTVPTPNPNYFPHNPIGKVSGTLQTVFGSIGIGVMGAGVITLGVLGISPSLLAILIILLGGSLMMEMNGSSIRNRLKRYQRYLTLFYGRNACSIDELSNYSGFSPKYLVKDLKNMIQIGMFPQGHIDPHKTMIMLNRERYELYLTEQAQLKEKMLLEQQQLKEQKKLSRKKDKTVTPLPNFEVINAVEEGRNYIAQINAAKGAITDIDVVTKIHRMEEIISKIIEYVEGHPEQLSEVRRFMQYYLPTTIKLLNAYHEFNRQPIQGDNITTAKKEIKDVLDTINVAFENLFDSLFQSASMDVSADISVLNTILAQEGLTEQDFNTDKK